MILIGRTFSPFVRRVAATLALYDLSYELRPYRVVDQVELIAPHNPLRRVPALVLPDGETLVDSTVILDHLDHLVPAERALVPREGTARREVLQALALAVGACEKAVAAFNERDRRPADKVWPEGLANLMAQARGGFAALEAMAGGEWLRLGRMTQADLTTALALDFAHQAMPDLVEGRYPRLEALLARVNAIPEVGATRFHA